jgi:DtxR family Mn-dependent transcriptional regulator
MPDDVRTKAVDDLLKAIYELQASHETVSTTQLAKTLNISAASVTDMIKRLAEPAEGEIPTILHRPYHGVRLTPRGEKIALEVIRHHRLIELYLVKALGYSWDEVHEEAERLEHVISEKLEARMAAALGNPTFDPHGDPIPALDGTLPSVPLVILAELGMGQRLEIKRVTDQSEEALRYLSEIGLIPGAVVIVMARSPLGDTLTIRVAQREHTISQQVAQWVMGCLE